MLVTPEEAESRDQALISYDEGVPDSPHILTIGHSNHPMEHFVELLRQHAVEVVADVRSSPYSKYATHFDREALAEALRQAGFQYVYLGSELGGRPRGDAYYDAAGHVLYDKVVESQSFRGGVARLEDGLRRYVVAALCAEEDPAGCHRRLLVGRVLGEHGVAVDHIRGDGRLQPEAELAAADPNHNQLSLFDDDEAPWKSIPSVSPKKRQSSSSLF
ncbi:MAG TPA: DUF488 domain-containing protein [Bryobacteraceae bacterium]|nr:DUF488 domain-containing protein [Bryobacteraceae bacterium]